VERYPESVTEKDCDGAVPLDLAKKKLVIPGHGLEVVSWLERRRHNSIEDDLFEACNENPPSLKTIRRLVKSYPDAVRATIKDKSSPKQLPLHVACGRNAPIGVLEFLVQQYPASVKKCDSDNCLPLHYICFHNASLDVVRYLVELYPDSVKEQDVSKSLPLHRACDSNAPLAVVRYLVERYPESVTEKDCDGAVPLDLAKKKLVISGHGLKVVSWLERRRQYRMREWHIATIMDALSRLDVRLINTIPRLFVILPAGHQNGWKKPKSWLRSKVKTTFHLFFICEHTRQVVNAKTPIELHRSKLWVKQIAPLLGTSLMMLQIAGKAFLGVDFQLENPAAGLRALGVGTHLQIEMLNEVRDILKESHGGNIVDRVEECIKKNGAISDGDIHKLNGEAFTQVEKVAREQQHRWRPFVEPVKTKSLGTKTILWVLKDIANDPQKDFKIIEE